MIKRLYIKNFAIVSEMEINFRPGFQVLTGETGAGKSIIVGALSLLCGERASSGLVSNGEVKAVLECELTVKGNQDVNSWLKANELDVLDSLIIRRELNSSGAARSFINDSPCTLPMLREVTEKLIDLHGQHQHQSLLRPENHVGYLDLFAGLTTALSEFRTFKGHYTQLKTTIDRLTVAQAEARDRRDLLDFQVSELRQANLDADEWESMREERKILENSEQLYAAANAVGEILYNADESTVTAIVKALDSLKNVRQIDSRLEELASQLESVRLTVEEAGRDALQYAANVTFEPDRLENLRNRESEIDWLLKKYQKNSVSDLIDLQQEMETELKQISNYDQQIAAAQLELEDYRQKLQDTAIAISRQRQEKAQDFSNRVDEILHSIGMQNAQSAVVFSKKEQSQGPVQIDGKSYAVNDSGLDIVEFHIRTNAGQPLKPLHKIVSGGEISRVMLALKALLADSDGIPVLIFDEIDNGISGKVADMVGRRMQSIAKNRQLIVITHLPQIAAKAETHFLVQKTENNGQSSVHVIRLDESERVNDIARLLAGENVSEQAVENARVLLNMQN